ncbi:MAG: glycyl-radical enzyme activating protein [Melioribacteraceae bacterium]|nr:glycyl-radical enzyme activating protein [Melioribacteraceae bacterium]
MKGYIFDIKRFAMHDGPGIRTTVFLMGCPLRCWWCHNPESIGQINKSDNLRNHNEHNTSCENFDKLHPTEYSVDELYTEIEKDWLFYEESSGGVTFSGGEPLVQIDFLESIMKKCKYNDFHTALDTTGYAKYTTLERIIKYTDLFLYDIKLFNDDLHKNYTGVSNKLILENLNRLIENDANVVLRIPLIPEITDTEENLSRVIGYIKGINRTLKIDLLPYNKLSESKYIKLNTESRLGKVETQSEEQLSGIVALFNNHGLEVTLRG